MIRHLLYDVACRMNAGMLCAESAQIGLLPRFIL